MKLKLNLTEQLLSVFAIVIVIVVISLGIVLPKTLLPTYESNVYNYLRQPLDFVINDNNINNELVNTEVAYVYVDSTNVVVSDNMNDIIKNYNTKALLSKIDYTTNSGKFKYKSNTYYYVTSIKNNHIKIAITNDNYVNSMRKEMLNKIFLIVGFTFVLISILILLWINIILKRIKNIKDNIDNINNENYKVKTNKKYNDELETLDLAVNDMRKYLKEQEEYKQEMYQNISHDFKTPITVMTSYIEASEDGIETTEKTFQIIKEQLKKLEIKVHSLLYLNKLNYIEDKKGYLNEQYDISNTLNAAVDKFKMTRPDVDFVLDINGNTIFRGSADMWEAIIDNILNNFTRYAKKKIKITVNNKKIILYNDGDNIDENVLTNIFTPYEKGVHGVFGLGLSIVKKTLHFLNYDISIENVKNGVKFIIYE